MFSPDSRYAAMTDFLARLAAKYDEEACLLGELDLENYSVATQERVFIPLGPRALHSIRESAAYAWFLAETNPADPRIVPLVQAVLRGQLDDPSRKSDGQFRWYQEEKDVRDGNGNFFIGLPLILLYRYHRTHLPDVLAGQLATALKRLIPVFDREAAHGRLSYVNPQLGRLVMLVLLTGTFAQGEETAREDALVNYCEFLLRDGINECYTSAYYQVDMAILLTMQLLAPAGAGSAISRRILDEVILPERAFFGQRYPAPFRRGYNPTYITRQDDIASILLGHAGGDYHASHADPWSPLLLYPLFRRAEAAATSPAWPTETHHPRMMRGKIFGDCHATSYLADDYLLGSIDLYPPLTTCWQTVTIGGSGWQDGLLYLTTQAPEGYSGILRLEAKDAEGNERTHPYRGQFQAEAIARLYPHLSFPPEPKVRILQHRYLAICLCKVDQLDAELQRFGFSFLCTRHGGQVLQRADGRLLIEHGPIWVGFIPLSRVDMENSNLVTAAFLQPAFHLRQSEEGLHVDLFNYDGPTQRFTQNHISSGFALAVFPKQTYRTAEQAENALTALSVEESWQSDRINAHIDERDAIRTVVLHSPDADLALSWNHYTDEEPLRTVNGQSFQPMGQLRSVEYL